jgi:catechol 2,3-dioxygenase-like lactoylglutathione lyase family enzyme
VTCSCCGEERETVGLLCHDDVRVCRTCAEWLAGQLGVTSTPTLPVTGLVESVAFYERAGFGVRVYEDENGNPGDFAFVDFDEQSVFDLDVADVDPALNRAGCYLIVQDVDGWHGRMAAADLPVSQLADQPWGMREFTLTDPSGNHIRIGQSVG